MNKNLLGIMSSVCRQFFSNVNQRAAKVKKNYCSRVSFLDPFDSKETPKTDTESHREVLAAHSYYGSKVCYVTDLSHFMFGRIWWQVWWRIGSSVEVEAVPRGTSTPAVSTGPSGQATSPTSGGWPENAKLRTTSLNRTK